jgi:hypothetical protein
MQPLKQSSSVTAFRFYPTFQKMEISLRDVLGVSVSVCPTYQLLKRLVDFQEIW